MAKKRQMPELVFIGPPQQRAKFRLVVFQVDARDEKGIPRKLTLLRNDETVHLVGGEQFMTGYIPEHMTRPKDDEDPQP